MVKAKDQQGHNFSKLWSVKFPNFLNAKMFKTLHFVKFLMIIQKQQIFKIIMNAILKFYTLAADVDYVL